MTSRLIGTGKYQVGREVTEKIALATTTFYNPDKPSDRVRASIAVGTIRTAYDCGINVSVVDGGSFPEFLRDIERYATIIPEARGSTMGKGRRQVITALPSARPVHAWSEPEKKRLMRYLGYCALQILEGKTDFVVPGRISLNSYPTAQQHAEKLGNIIFGDITETRALDLLDIWFGPKMWKKELTDLCFLQYDGRLGDRWETLPVAVMNAIIAGHNVLGVKVPYRNDPRQTEIEEHDVGFHIKRLEQLNNLVPAIKQYWAERHAA